MSSNRSTDRQSLCTFTFADGRRCRMPRQSGHPFLCCFHARREAQAQAAEEVGRDIRFFLSGDYLSAGDLSLALGRVFAAAASGQLKPKTAGTLAYLGQTLLQTIHLAENEYINAFSTDRWRRVIRTHIKENTNYLFPPANLQPPADQLSAAVEAGPEPGLSSLGRPLAGQNSTRAAHEPNVANHVAEPTARSSSSTSPDAAPSAVVDLHTTTISSSAQSSDLPAIASDSLARKRLPRNAANFASTVLSSAPSSAPPPVAKTEPPCSAGFTPASSPVAAPSPSGTPQSGVPSSDRPLTSTPAAPPTSNPSSIPSQSAPQPTRASDLPDFGAPANWDVLIPQTRGPNRRSRSGCRARQIRS